MKTVRTNVCPACGDYPIHYSGKSNPMRKVLSWIGYTYYRCYRCGSSLVGRKGITGAKPAGVRRGTGKHASAS